MARSSNCLQFFIYSFLPSIDLSKIREELESTRSDLHMTEASRSKIEHKLRDQEIRFQEKEKYVTLIVVRC